MGPYALLYQRTFNIETHFRDDVVMVKSRHGANDTIAIRTVVAISSICDLCCRRCSLVAPIHPSLLAKSALPLIMKVLLLPVLLWTIAAHSIDCLSVGLRNKHARTSTMAPLRMSVPNGFDTLTSGLASIARLPFGVTVSETAKRLSDEAPASAMPRLAQLYDIENERKCRAVRECISELDLVVEKVIPAASNSRVFVDPSYEYALPAGTTVPRLVVMEGSEEKVLTGPDDIISYLDDNFSDDSVISSSSSDDILEEMKENAISFLTEIGSYLAVLLRQGRGQGVCSAASATSPLPVPRPSKPLVLYSYEGNQFCRLVREVLTELDLVYELRSAGKKSPRRDEMVEITGGSSQCPYLIDPNTGESMFESKDIIQYLYKTYALWTPPSEILEAASAVVTPSFKPVYKMLAPMQVGSYNQDKLVYKNDISNAKAEIEAEVNADPVVVYTYSLSPFCSQATELLDNLGVSYNEISLGMEWIPGLISEPTKRAALGEMTGQTSLPHVFIGGTSIGGLFSGTPGLVPALEEGTLLKQIESAKTSSAVDTKVSESFQ